MEAGREAADPGLPLQACAQGKAGGSHAVFGSLFFCYVGDERRAGSKSRGCHSTDRVYLTLHHPGKMFLY